MDKSVLQRNIDNRYAVPFLILLILAGLHWFLVSPLMVRPFPDHFAVDHQGQTLFRIGAQWMTVEGESGLDLRPLDIDRHRGVVLPLDGGEWLINLGGQQETHRQRLRRFIRYSPGQGHESTLARCRAGLTDCRPWGDAGLALDDDFALVALSQSRFVLADTSRHRVYLLDGDGRELDRLTGVQFPNDLVVHADAVYVVDTNGGRVLRLQPSSHALGQPETVLRLSDQTSFRGRPLPIRLARGESDWWLIATNIKMANGVLFRVDTDWQAVSRVRDPELEDVVAVAADGDELLLATFRGDSLWRFDPERELLNPVDHPPLTSYLQVLDAEVTGLKRRTGFQVAILGTLALSFLTVGLLRSSAPAPTTTPSGSLAQRIADGPCWFAYKPEMLRLLDAGAWMLLFLPVLMALVLLTLGAMVLMGDGAADQRAPILLQSFWSQAFLALLMMAVGVYMFSELRRQARYRLGRDDQLLLLEDHAGVVHRIDPAEIRFDRFQLLWDGRLIPLRAGLYGWLIEEHDRVEGLMPLLEESGTRRNTVQLTIAWLLGKPGLIAILSLGIILGAMGSVLLLFFSLLR
jgi:hypothetical protein